MEQRDLLKDQIEQLGKVIAALISEFLGLINKGQINSGIEITNQALKSELDLDLQELIDTPNENFIEIIQSKKNLTNDNLDKLAHLLSLIAENQKIDSKKLFKKCLLIYEYLDNVDNTYSPDRIEKIKRIRKLI